VKSGATRVFAASHAFLSCAAGSFASRTSTQPWRTKQVAEGNIASASHRANTYFPHKFQTHSDHVVQLTVGQWCTSRCALFRCVA
jgi:hypothetical protein